MQPSSGATDTEVVVARVSTVGELVWAKRFGGPGQQYGFGGGVGLGPNGDVVLGGSFDAFIEFDDRSLTGVGSTDAFAASLRWDNGATIWAERFGGPANSSTFEATVSPDGTLMLLVGTFGSVTEFADRELTTNGGNDALCAAIIPRLD
jgi:hypothetical protein